MVKGWFIQSRVDTVELFPDEADEDSIGVGDFSFWFPDGSNTDNLGTFYDVRYTQWIVSKVPS